MKIANQSSKTYHKHRGINLRLKAKAVAKSAIRRIDDYQLIDQARKEIARINSRLAGYELELYVKQKQAQLRPMEEL